MSKATRAIAYVRCSTESQARSGLGLAAQRDYIKTYCEQRGLELAAIHSDEGASGTKRARRPGLQAAIDAIGKGDAFVVYALSRFARSALDAHTILAEVMGKGGSFISITENWDTTTPMGRALFGLCAIFAQLEADMIRERTLAALNVKRQRGEKLGGTVPIGYRVVRGKLVLDEAQIPQIRRVWELRRSGLSEERTAMQMARETGKSWNRSRVVQIMKSAALADAVLPVRLALPNSESCESSESHNGKSASGSA